MSSGRGVDIASRARVLGAPQRRGVRLPIGQRDLGRRAPLAGLRALHVAHRTIGPHHLESRRRYRGPSDPRSHSLGTAGTLSLRGRAPGAAGAGRGSGHHRRGTAEPSGTKSPRGPGRSPHAGAARPGVHARLVASHCADLSGSAGFISVRGRADGQHVALVRQLELRRTGLRMLRLFSRP